MLHLMPGSFLFEALWSVRGVRGEKGRREEAKRDMREGKEDGGMREGGREGGRGGGRGRGEDGREGEEGR